MKIKRIKISNILGIDELEVEPGAVTIAEGGNAAGKTSFLEAVKSAIGGGHDVSLLRNGAESGEVVLLLEDGTEISKRITEKGSYLDVTRDGGTRRAPQTWLNQLTDAVALNPVTFLEAKPASQVEMLLEAAPIAVTAEEVRDAVGDVSLDLPEGRLPGHGLEAIERVRKDVYDQRTGVNRLVRELEATVKRLAEDREAVEAPDGQEVARQVAADSAALEELQEARHEALMGVERYRAGEIHEIEETAAQSVADLQKRIRELEQLRDQRINEVEQSAHQQKEKIREAFSRGDTSLRERLAANRQREKAADAVRRAEETIQESRSRLGAAAAESTSYTHAIEGLDALKARMVEQLPLPGLEIRDGEIYREGVPFRRLNRATQVVLALQLARQRAGDLPIVCVDGLEALDEETFAHLVEAAAAEDVHLFATRVTAGELSIRKEDAHV